MTSHLGSWVSALADGQLPPEAAERALAHVAVCAQCAAELDAARAARRALADACDVEAAPGLTARLLALSASIPPTTGDPLRDAPRPAGHRPEPAVAPWEGPLTVDLAAAARRRRLCRLAAAGAGSVAVVAGALFAAGDLPVVVPDPSPQQVLTLLGRTAPDEAAEGQDVLPQIRRAAGGTGPQASAGPGAGRTAGEVAARAAAGAGLADVAASGRLVRGGDGGDGGDAGAAGAAPAGEVLDQAVLAWVSEHGWVPPRGLPEAVDVTAVRLLGPRGQVLELDLTGPQGHVVVRQQAGRLPAGSTAPAVELGLADRRVQLLSTEPWHVAWQAGDVVVDVAADVPHEVMTQVVAAFPADGYDAGVLPRIARGWSTVTGALPEP